MQGIQKSVSLKKYATFKIGGKAKYFFVAKNKDDAIRAVLWAEKNKTPFFILGGGSNLLISDRGFNGLVVKIQNIKYKILNTKILAEAGVSLVSLAGAATGNNLTGLEWTAGIPGTVGGAIFGNAGAFGKSMKNIIKEVEVFDIRTKKIRFLKNKDCKFGYRKSIFKTNKDLIILSVKMQLKKDDKKSIKNRLQKFLESRNQSQPLNFPSAGSVFKNPRGFSAGELIEKCGLKGKKIGKAKISEKHANFIVNLGNARAGDVIKLINLAKKSVKNKFGKNLEEEIQYAGFSN